jgi:hypothetical protein
MFVFSLRPRACGELIEFISARDFFHPHPRLLIYQRAKTLRHNLQSHPILQLSNRNPLLSIYNLQYTFYNFYTHPIGILKLFTFFHYFLLFTNHCHKYFSFSKISLSFLFRINLHTLPAAMDASTAGEICDSKLFSFDWLDDNQYIYRRLGRLTGLSNRPETQVNTVVTALRSGDKTGLAGQKLGVFDSSGSARPNKSQPSE